MKNLSNLFVLIIFLYMHSTAYAYDIMTHEQFNKEVSAFKDTQFGLNFDEFLANYLFFESGIDTEVHFYSEKMSIQGWIGYGGKREDELYPATALRVLHHFHNPLSETVDPDTAIKSWKEAGLGFGTYKDLGLNISGGCFGTSTAIAAQTQKNLGCEISSYEGDWSWETARKFYFTALTGDSTPLDNFTVEGETDSFVPWFTEIVKKMIGIGGYPIKGQTGLKEDEKNVYWARTFRAVGQVMHLVHDQAVPAHVRNDGHIPKVDYNFYEQTVEKKLHRKTPDATWIAIVNQAISNPNIFDKNILSQPLWGSPGGLFSNSSVTLPIGWVFDSDIYKESTGPSVTNSLSIGLSEYTNANFFSDDTIYKIGANTVNYFPYPELRHPDIASECYGAVTRTTKDHNGRPRVYYLKNGCGEDNGGKGYLLTAEQYFASWQTEENSDEVGDYSVLGGTVSIILDELVYQDYARLLFPRAIGYSKGLLDYFFRGRMEISSIHPQDLIIRGNGSGGISIFNIIASVRNATMDPDANNNPTYTNEDMGGGTLLAVAKYQVAGVPEYSVSKEISIDPISSSRIDATVFTEFQFNFSDKPIPWDASGIDFQVIFRGTLGNEKDIAVAVGRRPLFDGIMEVTPPSEYVYSIIDASSFYNADVPLSQPFSTLKASLRNLSAAKEVKEGTLTAIASYRKLKNYQPDMAGMAPLLSSEREETDSYSVSEPISINSSSPVTANGATEFTFDFQHSPIPAGITDLYLFIVFEGTIHDPATNIDQPDALVVGIKDLNEPQHLTYWNDTDYFLLRGYPRKADDIRDDPDVVRYDCFIDPHGITDSVKFYSSTGVAPGQELVRFDLDAGHYSRILVLTDTPDIYSVADTLQAPDNPLVPAQGFDYEYKFSRTINQLNSDGLWHSSPVLYSRGIRQHDRSYFINVWPAFFFYESVPVPDNDLLPVRASVINFPQP